MRRKKGKRKKIGGRQQRKGAVPMRYVVTETHMYEKKNPITFIENEVVQVGETYEGNENWKNWVYCTKEKSHEEGWVPKQLLTYQNKKIAITNESYTARELPVTKGELVIGYRQINGWVWCQRLVTKEEGWVPLENVYPIL